MKYNKLLLKTILLIFFFINIFTNNLQAGKQAFIVMKINNVIVTNLNIEKELRYLFALNNDLISVKKEDALVIAKNSYLREKIKEIEILKYFVLGNYENNEYSLYVQKYNVFLYMLCVRVSSIPEFQGPYF